MKPKVQFIALSLALALIPATVTVRVSAQHSHDDHDNKSSKKGMVRLSDSAWVGNIRLKSGMYHVKHIVEGDRHWLVFKTVSLGGGYREGSMWEGTEIARMECRVEPAMKSVRNTKVIFSRTEAGERSIQEIQIAGEKVRHML